MRRSTRSSLRQAAGSGILALIWLYQKLLSPVFAGSCRFEPSCSEYARQAVILHGPLRGSLLALWRVLRCQPLCRGGYDPVPACFPKTVPDTHAS
jgi:putative membrane protein insertion efficiency factor